MSLAQFPNFPRPPLPRSSPPITSPSQITTPSSTSGHRACCENGRPILTDPHTGQTVCSCQYPAGLMSYPRAALPPGLESVYNASAYAGYVALGTEGSAFYTPLGTAPYDLKESAEAWRTLAASQPGFPYDPMAVYPYGPGKNATRENTNTLKAWLYEHRKNPYPTKGEKIMLAIITKMTLTQVSTWFANARRRLKKENKMTWSPRNRSEDGSDDVDNQDDDDECADSRNRDVISPSDQHDLDITSSKPSSPMLSPGGHGLHGDNNNSSNNNNGNRPFKERIIRVDEDDDGDDDDDDDDDDDHHHREMDFVSRDAFGHRRHLDDLKDRPIPLSLSTRDRDRSPLRPTSDSDVREHVICRVRAGHSDDEGSRRPSSTSGEPRRSPSSPASGTAASSPSHPLSRSPTPRVSSDKPPASSQPAATRPKIWSISDFINTTSSSSTSSSSSTTTSSSSSSSNLNSSNSASSSSTTLPGIPSSTGSLSSLSLSSSLSSSLASLNRPGFISPSSAASPHRSIPGQGFLFLPHGAAHWQAAAARFAGMGGAYPLTLAHTSLSYPYNLAAPNMVRAGLEAHAQSVAQLARAAAEGNAARGEASREGDKLMLSGLARHPSGALFSPARDLDAVRPHGVVPPRLVVDTSL